MARTYHSRASSASLNSPGPSEVYHRPMPVLRTSSPVPTLSVSAPPSGNGAKDDSPVIFGMPLKYLSSVSFYSFIMPILTLPSLVTLAVQNAALSIVMHYSRVSIPPAEAYSTASAVLLNELLKGSISFLIAAYRVYLFHSPKRDAALYAPSAQHTPLSALRQVLREIFSPDCWKLSIPALLYVVQNSLQFVAISNLPVATFQVTYQMKILTTAAFSVALLRKRLSSTKWVSLIFLALGVAIVQIQTTSSTTTTTTTHHHHRESAVGSAHDSAPLYTHIMSPLKGFGAVTAACFTSGLAGVYFEMVLKNSKADLWVRNVQLSLFSLIPALLPTLYHHHATPNPYSPSGSSVGFFGQFFANFGLWAWATVAIQVFGGLITAVVIKYSDNILKGFATSLSIILSFLASVALFDFRLTSSFMIGSSVVLAATWMYNQPAGSEPQLLVNVVNGATGATKSRAGAGWPGSPVGPDEPILGDLGERDKKEMSRVPTPIPGLGNGSPTGSPTGEITPFGHSHEMGQPGLVYGAGQGYGLGVQVDGAANGNGNGGVNGNGTANGNGIGNGNGGWMEMVDTPRYLSAPYGSPYNSRTPSPSPPSPGSVPPPPPLSRYASSAGGSPNLGTGVWMGGGGGERRQ